MTKNITVSGSPTKTMSFNYSADNERVLKTENSGTTKNANLYIRGNNEYPITEKINLNTTLSDKIYIYGPTRLIAFKDATATYFVIKDHLGSTRILFRSTGSQYTTYDYSPFGSLMRATINGDTDYRFTGQEFDEETGLWNFRARLYDDELGIFYAIDPAGQNFSPFSYAGNNPVIYVDKDGRFWFLPILIGAAIGGGISGLAYSAFAGGDWTWSGFGNAVLGGAIAGGLSAIGGAFISNATLGMLNQTLSYTASSAIMGQDISTTGIIGSLVGGAIAGSIPAFQGIKGAGWIQNAAAEMVYGSMKTGITSGLGGGVTSLLEGESFFSGFETGFQRGLVTGAVTTGLTMFVLGTAVHPDDLNNQTATAALDKMETHMSNVGNSMGIYKPTFRSGGLLQWIRGRGQQFGTSAHITKIGRNYLTVDIIGETAHYYQMISAEYGGWANMSFRAIIEYFIYGEAAYNTFGTIEYEAHEIIAKYFLGWR